MEKNSPKKFSSKSWDAWLVRAAQIASIITSIVLAVFTGIQIHINKRIHEEDKALHQPIFQVRENYKDLESNANPYYKNLEIHNIGEPIQQINGINIYTYLHFEYHNDNKRDTFYIPINEFFSYNVSTPNLTGLIKYTKTTYPNYGEFGRIFNEVRSGCAPSEFAYTTLIHVTKINYLDIFGETQSKTFINENIADSKQIEKIEQRSQEKFGYRMWDIRKLSLSKIKEICGL